MKNASRMFRAAVISAIDMMGNDPATMAAVDRMASGFSSIDAMLNYLWKYDDGFGLNGDFIGKSEDISLVTGKPFAYWASLHDDGPWGWGPKGEKFTGSYRGGEFFPASAVLAGGQI